MIYNKFNNYIHNRFFNKNAVGTRIVLAVDEDVIQDFCFQNNIKKEQFLNETALELNRYGWYNTIKVIDNIPNYIGLIAIQIYVAYLMHEDIEYTERAYIPRLEGCLGNWYNIHNLLREYQDTIWQGLKEWANENSFEISIPQPGYYAGRYVQYPLSQALLNQEDLKWLPLIFENSGIRPYEELSFEDFKALIKYSDNVIGLTSHYKRIKERLIKSDQLDLLFFQIYSSYQNWEGKCIDGIKKNDPRTRSLEELRNKCVLDKNITKIEVLDIKNNCLTELNIDNGFLFDKIKKFFHLSYNRTIIFVKDQWEDEWEESRFFKIGNQAIIISEKDIDLKFFINKLDHNYSDYSNRHYWIFRVNITSKPLNSSFWTKYFSTTDPVFSVMNGLKLSRRSWMLGAGPDIFFEKPIKAWINGDPIELNSEKLFYSLRDATEQTYTLKVADQKPYKIDIARPIFHKANCSNGWIISKLKKLWELGPENFQISGFIFNFLNAEDINSGIREWINANIGNSKKSRFDRITITATKRSKYGIQ